MNLRIAGLVLLPALLLCQQPDPWSKTDLIEPETFAKTLSAGGKQPVVLCVAFPTLYNARHITKAVFAGQGSKPEGIESLKKAVAGLAKDTSIVIYCGCCPMERCPNLRPAFRVLKELGYTNVRVLSIPTNMHTDWYSKNYPTEDGTPAK